MTEGKNDIGKNRLDLVSPNLIEAVGWIRTFGTEKYGNSDNWKKIEDPVRRYTAAAMRHFEAYRSGEFYDEESGYPHLWHVACNIQFLIDLHEEHKNLAIASMNKNWKKKMCKTCKHSLRSSGEEPCYNCVMNGDELSEWEPGNH